MNHLPWSRKACLDLSIQHWLRLRAAKESKNEITGLRFTAVPFTRVAALNVTSVKTVNYEVKSACATVSSQEVCTSPQKGL